MRRRYIIHRESDENGKMKHVKEEADGKRLAK